MFRNYITGIRLDEIPVDSYLSDLPLIAYLKDNELKLTKPVTFLVKSLSDSYSKRLFFFNQGIPFQPV